MSKRNKTLLVVGIFSIVSSVLLLLLGKDSYTNFLVLRAILSLGIALTFSPLIIQKSSITIKNGVIVLGGAVAFFVMIMSFFPLENNIRCTFEITSESNILPKDLQVKLLLLNEARLTNVNETHLADFSNIPSKYKSTQCKVALVNAQGWVFSSNKLDTIITLSAEGNIDLRIKPNDEYFRVKGYVKDSKSNLPISDVSFYNADGKLVGMTNNKGFFTIKISPTDSEIGTQFQLYKMGYKTNNQFLYPGYAELTIDSEKK